MVHLLAESKRFSCRSQASALGLAKISATGTVLKAKLILVEGGETVQTPLWKG